MFQASKAIFLFIANGRPPDSVTFGVDSGRFKLGEVFCAGERRRCGGIGSHRSDQTLAGGLRRHGDHRRGRGSLVFPTTTHELSRCFLLRLRWGRACPAQEPPVKTIPEVGMKTDWRLPLPPAFSHTHQREDYSRIPLALRWSPGTPQSRLVASFFAGNRD